MCGSRVNPRRRRGCCAGEYHMYSARKVVRLRLCPNITTCTRFTPPLIAAGEFVAFIAHRQTVPPK